MSSQDYATRVLRGDRRAVARLITLIENQNPDAQEALRLLYPSTGMAFLIGITGPPGAGKSTLVDLLISAIRKEGLRVGVIAVDPCSPFTGGAILGDRIRMKSHASDPDVFIRSMSSRGQLGGLALATRSACDVLDAYGCDVVIVETVGVGQSEIEIAQNSDSTVLVLPPNLGDGIQAIKAGIMEVPDLFVVNKADLPGASQALAEIRGLLDLLTESERPPAVLPIRSLLPIENSGIFALWNALKDHRHFLSQTHRLEEKRALQASKQVETIALAELHQILRQKMQQPNIQALLEAVQAHRMAPAEAAHELLSQHLLL